MAENDKKDAQAEPRELSRDEQRKAYEQAEKDAAKAEYNPKTAQEIATTVGMVPTDNEKEKALEAGVIRAEFINYEGALENYEGRDDIEPLSERRAREGGSSFRDASFRREIGGTANVGVTSTDDTPVSADRPSAVKDEVRKPKSGK